MNDAKGEFQIFENKELNKDKCRVKNCKEYKRPGDSIFCFLHRDKWRAYCHANRLTADTPEQQVNNHLSYFCID